MVPVKAQPLHAVDNGVDIFLIFFGRIRIVKAQMTAAAIVARQTKIEANRFGMADVQIAVGLGRETRDHGGQSLAVMVGAASVFAAMRIGIDNAAQEV